MPVRDSRRRRRGARQSDLLVVAAFLTAALALPAAAIEPAASYAHVSPLTAPEMRGVRGGMEIAGMDVDFGAQVRVLTNGILAAETLLTLSDTGEVVQTTTIFSPGVTLIGDNLDGLTGDNLDLAGLSGTNGVVIDADGGASVALHDIALDHASGILINTAPHVDVRQVINMQLTINDFAAVAGDLHAAALLGRIGSMGAPAPALAPGS